MSLSEGVGEPCDWGAASEACCSSGPDMIAATCGCEVLADLLGVFLEFVLSVKQWWRVV